MGTVLAASLHLSHCISLRSSDPPPSLSKRSKTCWILQPTAPLCSSGLCAKPRSSTVCSGDMALDILRLTGVSYQILEGSFGGAGPIALLCFMLMSRSDFRHHEQLSFSNDINAGVRGSQSHHILPSGPHTPQRRWPPGYPGWPPPSAGEPGSWPRDSDESC